jgi:uncharacterized protein with PIN domain
MAQACHQLMNKKKAYFRFYAELNDFLAVENRQKTFIYHFSLNPSVKDAIEACGVPHSEIEIILVNNLSVDFTYKLKDGDRIAVYPVFESMDISPLIRLREKPLRHLKFILDQNLGKLARKLRMMGFDALFYQGRDNQYFIRKAMEEKRVLLTRSKNLLKNKNISHGFWVRSDDPDRQIKEIYDRFEIRTLSKPFIRCTCCNCLVRAVPKHKIINNIPEKTAVHFDEFWQCTGCKKIYWRGSHFQKMLLQIDLLADR